MSHRLLLAIDEQWPARPDCPWVLLGPDGQPTAEGQQRTLTNGVHERAVEVN